MFSGWITRTMVDSRQELLDDEWLIVRHSGEIPEIALTSVLYYLTEDGAGPRISLSKKERSYLQSGAEQRYHEIVLRDLQPGNRDKTIYRGVKRSIYNYHRFSKFCRRWNVDSSSFQPQVASAFLSFLHHEVEDVTSGKRCCCLNVSYHEIIAFSAELHIASNDLPDGFRKICPK